MTEIIGGIL